MIMIMMILPIGYDYDYNYDDHDQDYDYDDHDYDDPANKPTHLNVEGHFKPASPHEVVACNPAPPFRNIIILYNILLLESPCSSVRPSVTEKYRIIYSQCNSCTMHS